MIPRCLECVNIELLDFGDGWLYCPLCGREFAAEDIPQEIKEVEDERQLTE